MKTIPDLERQLASANNAINHLTRLCYKIAATALAKLQDKGV